MKCRRKAPAQAFRVTKENVAEPKLWPAWAQDLQTRRKGGAELEAGYAQHEKGPAIYMRLNYTTIKWAFVGDWIVLEDGLLDQMSHRDFSRIFEGPSP